MSEINENPSRKTRTGLSPELIAALVWETERKGNALEIRRRENIVFLLVSDAGLPYEH